MMLSASGGEGGGLAGRHRSRVRVDENRRRGEAERGAGGQRKLEYTIPEIPDEWNLETTSRRRRQHTLALTLSHAHTRTHRLEQEWE